MMCPVCKRDLAPTLSICLTCGAMINDTVREELETKISKTADIVASNSGRLTTPKADMPMPAPRIETPAPQTLPPTPAVRAQQPPVAPPLWAQQSAHQPTPPPIQQQNPPPPTPQSVKPATQQAKQQTPPAQSPQKASPAAQPKPIAARFDTADLRVKKTSPTLVEFQTKKATIPEWRLQLQNSVRQKVGTNRRQEPEAAPPTPQKTTSGANALKVEFVEEDNPTPRHQNPRVANALQRIENSRRTFTNQPVAEQPVNIGKAQPANRNYPFNVVAKSGEPPRRAGQKPTVNASPKPMLVSPLKIEKRGFDTNKLPPVPTPTKVSSSVELNIEAAPRPESPLRKRAYVEDPIVDVETIETEIVETEEIDDLAPLSMRFNAGLFDFIIGIFGSLILLSPFMMSGGSWFTVSGFFAIAATVAIVMFLYLTISVSFVGRTFGMRLFSLELVDVEENSYPTLHQAAVNSAVYLLSIALAGLGFLPVFFNEERRAAHDILSGTILIREL